MDALYDMFNREIKSHKVVVKLVNSLPGYLGHTKKTIKICWQRLPAFQNYIYWQKVIRIHVRSLQSELSSLDDVVLEAIEDSSERKQAYSVLQENLETIQKTRKEIEDEQLVLSEKIG